MHVEFIALVALAGYATIWTIRVFTNDLKMRGIAWAAKVRDQKPVECDVCMATWGSLFWSLLAFVPQIHIIGWWVLLFTAASSGLTLFTLRLGRLISNLGTRLEKTNETSVKSVFDTKGKENLVCLDGNDYRPGE